MKKSIYILLISVFILPLNIIGQSSRLKYADRMYENKSFYQAAEAYEDVLARNVDSNVVANKIADAYHKIGNKQKAAKWYDFIYRNEEVSQENLFKYGILLRSIENYDKSNTIIQEYASKYDNKGISESFISPTPISSLLEDKGWFSVVNQNVNTEYSEIGVTFYKPGEVLLSSSQKRSLAIGQTDAWSGDYFYDIYKASLNDQNQIGKMNLIKSKGVTSKYHDGPSIWNEKLGFLYFTRNNYIDGSKGTDSENIIRLKIYRAKMVDDKFVDVEELNINNDEYSTGHPAINVEGTKLYFSSDRPGGFGGMDLYVVDLNENGLPEGEPKNLGSKVNTLGNEVFPTHNQSENLLFFSSDGHAGLGGLDVYVARLKSDGDVKNIENLGVPVNSTYDDFSFINDEEQTKGFYASNRPGGEGSDDVYGVIQHVKITNSRTVSGLITDVTDGDIINNATIQVLDNEGNIVAETTSNPKGEYYVELDNLEDGYQVKIIQDDYISTTKPLDYTPTTRDYVEDFNLVPSHDYYFSGIIKDKQGGDILENVTVTITDETTGESLGTFSTGKDGTFKSSAIKQKFGDNINYSFTLEKDNYETKIVSLAEVLESANNIAVDERVDISLARHTDGSDLNDIYNLSPIIFDLNSSYLTPQAKKELDKVVKILKDNPKMEIHLKAHTDSRADDNYNMWLSDRRANRSMDYIVNKGIAANRLKANGYGESQPIYTDEVINQASSEAEKEALHEKNRRTEFIITKSN
ncbi:MAG: OmpA family protein [Brumimicrobium sp.]